MAAVPVQSLRVSDIKDPTVLFERYSTDEIRGVERKVRGEIEQKKEELRQMVGERYRDLIEAADTIGEMRECSEKVVRSIQDMQNYCHTLKHNKHTPQSSRAEVSDLTASGKTLLRDLVLVAWMRCYFVPDGKTVGEKQSQEKFFAMAAQIKLLLEMPERMWSALEGAQYLQATQLHLLCAHLHRLLHLDTPTASYSPVLSRFPILIQQVAAAGHFRSTILLDSKSVLRGRAVSDQAIAEALVSTMLLEDSSPRQALADFLLARTASIQQLLKQPQHGAGIKAQVCSLVELLVTTLYQAHAVFFLPPEGRAAEPGLGYGLLFTTLENVTSGKGRKVLHGEVSAGSWFKHLPSSVTDFQPALRTLAQPIQSEQLRDTLQHWIDTCKEDMRSGVSSLLIYVKSVKGLASIRDAVCDLLSSDSISQHWRGVCERLLDKPLDLWHDLLQPLFLHRLQVITREGMESISSSCKQLLSSTLQELEGEASSRGSRFESDVSSFLWCESQSDLPSDAAWVNVSQRNSRPESGLSMKTHALTPRVQNFCAALDSKLKVQLEDLGHFLPSDTPAPCQNRYTDGPAVEQALNERCTACLTDIMSSVRTELAASSGRMSSVLFLARLCQSMAELCPSLKQCILGRQGESRNTGSPRVQSRKLAKAGVSKGLELSPAQVTWARVKEELLACSMEAYRIWSSTVSQTLVRHFASSLHAPTAGSVLITATNWEELEIQEEAESGNTVVSKIHLPVQPSWYVQSLLFHLCLEVNKVGGHAVPRITLTELLRACLDQVLTEYEKLTQPTQNKDAAPPITQNRSLQLLFDVRYLSAALTARLEDTRSSRSHVQPRIQEICDALESHIDPFDLDVFTPHLNSNLNRLTQRTSVLLGLLTGAEKQFTPRSSNVSSQEPYNILPLASSQIRFGLLPLSMSNSRKAKSSSRATDISRPLIAPSSNPIPEDSFRPGNLFRQLANQEEEPAGPSLFKLGWLSGMGK